MSSIAIRAVQIWIKKALGLVPTKAFTFGFCLRVMKRVLHLLYSRMRFLELEVAPSSGLSYFYAF